MNFLKYLYFEFKRLMFMKPYVIVFYEIDNMEFKKYFKTWNEGINFVKECLDNPVCKNVSTLVK